MTTFFFQTELKSKLNTGFGEFLKNLILLVNFIFYFFFQRKQYQLGKEIFDKYIASSTSAVKLERGIVKEMESFLLGNSPVSSL